MGLNALQFSNRPADFSSHDAASLVILKSATLVATLVDEIK